MTNRANRRILPVEMKRALRTLLPMALFAATALAAGFGHVSAPSTFAASTGPAEFHSTSVDTSADSRPGGTGTATANDAAVVPTVPADPGPPADGLAPCVGTACGTPFVPGDVPCEGSICGTPPVEIISANCNIDFMAPLVKLTVWVDNRAGEHLVGASVSAQLVGTDSAFPAAPSTIFSGTTGSSSYRGVPVFAATEPFTAAVTYDPKTNTFPYSAWKSYRCHGTATYNGLTATF